MSEDTWKILDREYSGGSGITLSKGMNLPHICDKSGDMFQALVYAEGAVIKAFIQIKIIIQGIFDSIRTRVYNRFAFQYPFQGFTDLIVTKTEKIWYNRIIPIS